jgi:hypothetical protein
MHAWWWEHANTMELERTKYEEYLEIQRVAGGGLGDLFTRYAITLPATDADIAVQIRTVRTYWREIQGRAKFREVARFLLAEDQRLRAEYGAKMDTAAWWQARQFELNMPVSIYLADSGIHEQVEAAVEDWLTTADGTIHTRDEPVTGSWFRRMEAGIKKAVDTPAGREAVLTAKHIADSRLIQAQDAYVTATLLQNIGPVLLSLQPTKDAVVRAGALLIVKIDWVVQVHQLTAAQQAILDHQPQLVASPKEIVVALQSSDSAAREDAMPSPARLTHRSEDVAEAE